MALNYGSGGRNVAPRNRYRPGGKKKPGVQPTNPVAQGGRQPDVPMFGSGGALGTPGTVAPIKSSPPPDPMFEAAKAAADLKIRLGDAYDTYQTGQIEAGFGNLGDPTADLTSNPYSRAAQLAKSYRNAKRGTTNSYASSGQLYAGSLQNAQEANLEGYNTSLDSLKKEKQGLLDELLKGKLDRYSTTGATVTDDQLQSLLRLLGQG